MKLSVKERLELNGLFPLLSDEMTQVLIRDINVKVRLSQEEMGLIGLKREQIRDGLQLNWDEGKLEEKEILFTHLELAFLKDQREKCDKEKSISQGMLSICLKIHQEELTEPISDREDKKGAK